MSFLVVGASIAGAVIIGGGWYIGTFNTFVTGKQDVKTQWSNLKTEYQRRADLILNLSSTVKSFKKHEKETLIGVAQARGGVLAPTKQAEASKMGMVDDLMRRLMVVVEQYPQLKSDATHLKLMDELRVTEDRVNICRTDYNGVVRDFNILVNSFPTAIVANFHGFTDEMFFEATSPDVDKAPIVNLE